MSKAIQGAVMLAGAVGMGVAAFLDPVLVASPLFDKVWASLILGGISMEAGAIAGALTQNRGVGITTRQTAALRQIIYGEQRVPGVVIYQSTTGSHHDQYNYIIVLAGHVCDVIENLYLDGRQVFWDPGSFGNTTRNGVNFGGSSDGSTHIGPGGAHYNFGTPLVYCEARWGDQAEGDVISGMTANDPNWAADGHGNSPWCGGCTYVYLKVEFDTSMFPQPPEIRFTVRGKNDILDPRTGIAGYSFNWALIMGDILETNLFGLADVLSVNRAQLVAAANVCDEQVAIAIGGTESRYCGHWHYDAGVSPGDQLQTFMNAAMGRLSRIGGEWYIWPAYWQGPSFTFDASILTGPVQWMPYRSLRELCNRVNGTYIAPNSPWNVAGNLYDANGWYNGSIANQFPFAFQPTNYPQYAQDFLHGYAADVFLEADSGVLGPWSSTVTYSTDDAATISSSPVTADPVIYLSLQDNNVDIDPTAGGAEWAIGTTYAMGAVVVDGATTYVSLQGGNTGHEPAEQGVWWLPYWTVWSNQLPLEVTQNCCLSISQAQRCAKIALLRNRQQGSGTLSMHLEAWQMQPLDVMLLNFPDLGWAGKQLEITDTRFLVQEQDGVSTVRFEVSVQETDQSIYEWLPNDELGVNDTPSNPTQPDYALTPPSDLTLASNSTTAVLGADGVNQPRILASWLAPADVRVTQIQIQYQLDASPLNVWIDAGTVDVATTSAFIAGVVSGDTYNLRIRSLAANGATSVWVETDGCLVSAPNSLQGTYTIDSGTLSGPYVLSQPSATEIDMVACTCSFGGLPPVNYSARTFTIPTPTQETAYYVTVEDPAQQGDTSSPILAATCQTSDALVGLLGHTYMGAILAEPNGGSIYVSPGGWPSPGSFQVGP
jgi:hypothetical protein